MVASIAVLLVAACGIDALGTAAPERVPERSVPGPDGDAGASLTPDAAPDTEATTVEAGPDDRDATATAVACAEPGGLVFAGHCYFPLTPRTQPQAKTDCAAAGAHLVTITSAPEQTFLATVGTGDRWIGLEAASPTNDRTLYTWVTGETVTASFWYVNDPDNLGPCVAQHGTIQEWVDRGCGDTNPAVCERE